MAAHFTVYNYARRGRGGSGDTAPYALAREIEDIDALIAEAGGMAHLFGVSSGGALVLEAAAAGLAIDKLAVYEVPYSIGGEAVRAWRTYVERLEALLAAGHRGDALTLFMRLAGAPEEVVTGAQASPAWASLEAIAHTLAYDAACLGDGLPQTDRLAGIARPLLVITGSTLDPRMGGLRPSFFADAANVIALSAPKARRLTLEGQTHVVDPDVLGPVLVEFFT